MGPDQALGAAFATWTLAWLVCVGLGLAGAALLPLSSWAGQLGGRLERLDAVPRGRWLIAGALLLLGALFRLPALSGDPPARLLTYAASFGSDEGVWTFLAAEWSQGRNPLGGPEYLPGALTLPYTLAQFLVFKTIGVGLIRARLLGAIAGASMGPVAYLGLRRSLGPHASALAGALLATSYLLSMYQRTAMVDGVLVLLGLGVMLATRNGLDVKTWPRVRLLLAGLLLGVTLWTKISGLPLVGGLLLMATLPVLSRRPTRWAAGLWWLAGGSVAIGLVALLVYAVAGSLATAAGTTLSVNVRPPPEGLGEWGWRLWQVLDRDTTFVHMPIIALTGAGTLVAGAIAVFRRRLPDPALGFAAGWWMSTLVMLAHHAYLPTRYYLQVVPPTIVLAAAGAVLAWRWLGTRDWHPWRVRSLLVALVCADVLFSLWRYGSWLVDHDTSQRDVGNAIARLAHADADKPIVSGPWSFNLALSGDFTPFGFWPEHPPTVQQAAAHGATHFLTAGPIPDGQVPSRGWVRLRLRGTFRYYANYFEPKADLHLYAIDRVRPGEVLP